MAFLVNPGKPRLAHSPEFGWGSGRENLVSVPPMVCSKVEEKENGSDG
jgi:hypothetical protein